jgi:ABC-2 type transport system permease protein
MQTAVYLVPGVMCMIMCLLTIILTSMSMAREKEIGTFETLISAPVKGWEILLGKTLPYVLLGMCDVPLVVGVGRLLFGVPMTGAMWKLVLAAFVFVCTTVTIGTLVSTFARNQQQAMMGGFLFLFPAIQLSGVMAPLENIPKVMVPLTYLNPLSYFVVLLRNIMLKGGNDAVLWKNVLGMAAVGAACALLTAKRFRQKLN